MSEDEHVMQLVETIRIKDCLQLTYVCACGAATRRKLYDRDFNSTEQPIMPPVASTSKNGRKAVK